MGNISYLPTTCVLLLEKFLFYLDLFMILILLLMSLIHSLPPLNYFLIKNLGILLGNFDNGFF